MSELLTKTVNELQSGANQNSDSSSMAGRKQYEKFCAEFDFGCLPGEPTNNNLLRVFAEYLIGQRLKFNTVNRYLSDVRMWHLRSGFDRIQADYLASARLRKHKVTAAGQAQPKQSIPIPTLLLMKKKLDLEDTRHLAVWTCFLMMVFTLCRSESVVFNERYEPCLL